MAADSDSWQRAGVQGLQTVVLYSLPELDGAIETMVLGGLVGGDKIVVLPERVRRLTNRCAGWHWLLACTVRWTALRSQCSHPMDLTLLCCSNMASYIAPFDTFILDS